MYEKYIKRGLDFTAASIALVIFFIPGILIALWVKMDSKGPIIFKQRRYGKDKKPFTMYKFRTMSVSAPNNKATSSFKSADNYITRSGRILRKLSIDELPQLLNVLNGSMSIIGPRPVVLAETRLIKLRDKHDANSIKPGITGWAQVNGRDDLLPEKKALFDGHYVKNISLSLDIKCILLTIYTVLSQDGNRDGHEFAIKNTANEIEVDL